MRVVRLWLALSLVLQNTGCSRMCRNMWRRPLGQALRLRALTASQRIAWPMAVGVERLLLFPVPPAPPDTAGNARGRCLLRASAELDLWIRHVGFPLACVGLV